MNKAQKMVLVALAVVDVLVIGGMGNYIHRATQRTPPQPTPTLPPDTSACTETLLQALSGTGGIPIVSWHTDRATLRIDYLGPTGHPGASPQLLWDVLDALPHPLPGTCPIPDTVTLTIVVQETTTVRHAYTIACSGSVLGAWLERHLDDDEFARLAQYRALTQD